MLFSLLAAGLVTFLKGEVAANIVCGAVGQAFYDVAKSPIAQLARKWQDARISNHDLERALERAYGRAIGAIALGLTGGAGPRSWGADKLSREFADAFDENFFAPFAETTGLTEVECRRLRAQGKDYCRRLSETADQVLGGKGSSTYETIDQLLFAGLGGDLSRTNTIIAQRSVAADELIKRVDAVMRGAAPADVRDRFCQLLAYAPRDMAGKGQTPLLLGAILYFFQEELKADVRVSAIMTHHDLRQLRIEQASQKDELTKQLTEIRQELDAARRRGDLAATQRCAAQEVGMQAAVQETDAQLAQLPVAEEIFAVIDAGMSRYEESFSAIKDLITSRFDELEYWLRADIQAIRYSLDDIKDQIIHPQHPVKTYGWLVLAIMADVALVVLIYLYFDQWVKIPLWSLLAFMILSAALVVLVYFLVRSRRPRPTRASSA